MPYTVRDATEALDVSPTISQHSIEGLTSLKVAVRRITTVNGPTIIPPVTKVKSARATALPTTSFCPGPIDQGIIAIVTWVMGCEYLIALKKEDFDALETKFQETYVIYKRIEWAYGDVTPL